jgi:hypothetical protein
MLHLSVLSINLALGAMLQGRANFFMDATESQFLKPDHGVLPQFNID